MKYKIISQKILLTIDGATDKLSTKVNEAIDSGWELLGGICCNKDCLFQSMVKKHSIIDK